MQRVLIKWSATLVVLLVAMLAFFNVRPGLFADTVYPLKFKSEIAAASEEFQLRRTLIAALIFTESRFKEGCPKSNKGAIGLTQMLPSTAASVARNLGVTDFSVQRLCSDPGLAIRLGTAYLRSAYDRAIGKGASPELAEKVALAHYNGGPRMADILLATNQTTGLASETSKFVSLVGNREKVYLELYGPGDNWVETAEKPFAFKPGQNILNLLDPNKLAVFLGG
ncbi:transglycosylase SLT domain-containing protein [Candidatus Berkelbacteria bacterium]|nr:transglycosylase SLT domain-containing protein [Candidatus Berkelbacteria bacterium]